MKIKVSYSILSAWESGSKEQAVNNFFKIYSPSSQAMNEGTAFHKSWEESILKHKRLPKELSTQNQPLIAPRTEVYLKKDITPQIEYSGIIDCLDEPILYEFKSGNKVSSDYANTKQIDGYALLCAKEGIKIEKGFYLHYNQKTKDTDCAMVWITPKRLERVEKWIIKNATEFYNYLLENKLYERYQ
jgi:hypothetical protein